MDFIKTSSLRALIELTFQRKWNGLIWMSRKGVIAKRVKAAPDGHIENQRRTRRPAGRGTNVPRSAKTVFRPTEVSAKVQTTRPITHTTRETLSRGRPSQRHATPRTTMRASREQASRPRNSLRVPRPMHPSEPGRTSHVRPRNHRPNSSADQPADREIIRPRPFRLGQRPDCPADRPDRPSERRGRPEAVFEAQSAQFKPKAGADLARLGLAAFILRAL
ncbi:unnamed protein product [Microthlaspi erraticum]|uniref:Uncharacterized protein n=1 Tax=Microthlaspi erraticum TaxID=1685480 RepID=A0A6D2JTT0_9BRAS|nr:unnamed protein product [Microthlaspi erraticum]